MIIDGHIDQQGNSSDGEEDDDVEDDADAAELGVVNGPVFSVDVGSIFDDIKG